MDNQDEPLQFHPNPKELWEEYYRVIAPVIVYKLDDEESDEDTGQLPTTRTVRDHQRYNDGC